MIHVLWIFYNMECCHVIKQRESLNLDYQREIFVSTLEIFLRRWKNVLCWKTARPPQMNLINSTFISFYYSVSFKVKDWRLWDQQSCSKASQFIFCFCVCCLYCQLYWHFAWFPRNMYFWHGLSDRGFFWKLSVGNSRICNVIYSFLSGYRRVCFHFEG